MKRTIDSDHGQLTIIGSIGDDALWIAQDLPLGTQVRIGESRWEVNWRRSLQDGRPAQAPDVNPMPPFCSHLYRL